MPEYILLVEASLEAGVDAVVVDDDGDDGQLVTGCRGTPLSPFKVYT
jgi:hypothetical protein